MYYKLMFNDSVSLVYESIIRFHDKIMLVLILIGVFIFFSLVGVWYKHSFSLKFIEKNTLEVVWTIIPAIILVFLSIPSLSLLYYIDSPSLSGYGFNNLIKIIGHQWYWSYEYKLNGVDLLYDSFMIPSNDLILGSYRLLETDKPLVVSVLNNILVQGITEDVIHSWCCPSLGVKFDVVPGRLNSFNFVPLVVGTYYGQCSEICGAKHSFMPIEIEIVG